MGLRIELAEITINIDYDRPHQSIQNSKGWFDWKFGIHPQLKHKAYLISFMYLVAWDGNLTGRRC